MKLTFYSFVGLEDDVVVVVLVVVLADDICLPVFVCV